MRGRRRSRAKKYPHGIDSAKLPKRCYWDEIKKHWYTVFEIDGKQKRAKIADKNAKMSDLHKAMEARAGEEIDNVIWLRKHFCESLQYKQLAAKTREDYDYCAKLVESHPSKLGTLTIGQVPLQSWNPTASQKLIDQIATANGPSAAVHCMKYLRRLFNWSEKRGHISRSPLGKIELPKERKLRRLPSHEALARLIPFAQERGSQRANSKGSCAPYLWKVLVIGKLCRLRGIEILALNEEQKLDVGLYCKRTKGSNDNITRWNPELEAAVNAAITARDSTWKTVRMPIPLQPKDRLIFVNNKGRKISASAWHSAFDALLKLAVAEKIIREDERFGLHDMKRRSITDTKGGRSAKLDGGGHADERMLSIYNFEVPISDAAGD